MALTTIETGIPLVTEDTITVADDYVLFLDGSATGNANKEQFSDVMTLIAGTGLSASSGVLNVDASQTGITSVGALGTGSIGTGFGTINNAAAITGTVITATTNFAGALTGNVTGNVSGTAPAGSLTGTTLSSSVVTSSITTVGTIASGTWQGDAVAAAYMAQGTTSAKGALELATAAEINTSTDPDRAMTPDLFAASNYGIRYVQIMAVAKATDLTVTDGLAYFHVPAGLNGMDLREVHAECFTAPTGANVVVEISKNGNSTQMLGTNLRIDIDETGSDTGAGAVNTDGSEAVATNDLIQINCTQIGSSTVGAGLLVTMGFRIP